VKIENLCGAVSTADQDAVAVIEERGGQDRAGLEQKVRLALETRPGGDLRLAQDFVNINNQNIEILVGFLLFEIKVLGSFPRVVFFGVPVWRSLVHGLGLDISVEIEVRFRESSF